MSFNYKTNDHTTISVGGALARQLFLKHYDDFFNY